MSWPDWTELSDFIKALAALGWPVALIILLFVFKKEVKGLVSGRKLKKYVPIYEEFAVDEDLLNEGRRNIRDYFQTKGYFDVRVAVAQTYDQSADKRVVTYQVNLGEKHKLESIKFDWALARYAMCGPGWR